MTIPNHIAQARSEARSAAARILFHPSHILDEREGGCSACEAQGSALARVCAAVDDSFCPTCRMNVSAADHNDAQCEAEYQA